MNWHLSLMEFWFIHLFFWFLKHPILPNNKKHNFETVLPQISLQLCRQYKDFIRRSKPLTLNNSSDDQWWNQTIFHLEIHVVNLTCLCYEFCLKFSRIDCHELPPSKPYFPSSLRSFIAFVAFLSLTRVYT